MPRATLPPKAVRDLLDEAIEAAGELTDLLEELDRDHETWRIWNLGGAAFGRPQFPGPGQLTGDQFAKLADNLYAKLNLVKKSFENRESKDEERAARRRAKRGSKV